MRLPGEEEPGRSGISVIYMVVGVSAFVLLLLFALLQSNNKEQADARARRLRQEQEAELAAAAAEEEAEEEEAEPKLRAEDLDFWDMYPVEEQADEDAAPSAADRADEADEREKEAISTRKDRPDFTKKAEEEQQKTEEATLEDPAADGKHTLVTTRDGKEEWVLISPYLPKNTYDYTKLEDKAGLKRYMENGKKISYVGVDISKDTGDVNFYGLKTAGVDYVMIRLGARGYSSGQIALDENFKENIEGAIAEGLGVGVYFYSQAISQEEAVQEANLVLQNLEPYRANIKYPVAFDMEFVANDEARIDGLSREDRTAIATAFLEAVRGRGYVPMLYGNKEWLIKEIDLAKLQDYDVWLAQDEDIPDYPYQYAMWQYTSTGVVNGIRGDANLNICFVGYSQR